MNKTVTKEDLLLNDKEIIEGLFRKYSNERWVLNKQEIRSKIKSIWGGKWAQLNHLLQYDHLKFGLKSGIVYNNVGFSGKLTFLIDSTHDTSIKLSTLKQIRSDLLILSDSVQVRYGTSHKMKMKLTSPEIKFLREFISLCEEDASVKMERRKQMEQEELEKRSQEIKQLQDDKSNLLKELDKDGNGVIDVIEGGDDFMKLFRKHQKLIQEFDVSYINNLVKVSNFLKLKKDNIQSIFKEISKTKNQKELESNVSFLKEQIQGYQLVLFHSLHLINSIVQGDLITVNEIYEDFDKLKIFKSDHEREVSEKLDNIGEGLSSLMVSINQMERSMVQRLQQLSYVTQEGFSHLNDSLTKELQSINSNIDTTNLFSMISSYQLYRINKKLN